MLAADNHPPRIAAPGLDQVDLGLIRLLQADGRASQEELAREVGLSRPAVHERLRKLEQHGVIQGYTVHVDWSAVGLPILAFILVRTTGRCAHSTAETFRNRLAWFLRHLRQPRLLILLLGVDGSGIDIPGSELGRRQIWLIGRRFGTRAAPLADLIPLGVRSKS